MTNFHFKQNSNYRLSSLEISEKLLTRVDARSNLKSVYSTQRLSTVSGVDFNISGRTDLVKPCVCDLEQSDDTKMAYTILKYQLKDRKAKAAHLKNLKRSLERRLSSARASGDHELLATLNKEFKELVAS